MNFVTLLRTKIMPGLRSVFGEDMVTGSSSPRVTGYSLTIRGSEGISKKYFHLDESNAGISLTCGLSNVNVGNEYFTEDPSNILDLIIAYVKENSHVPFEGRSEMKFEMLERELGTLTGVNAEALVNEKMNDDENDDLSSLGEMVEIERVISV